jgi:hypothetical protein
MSTVATTTPQDTLPAFPTNVDDMVAQYVRLRDALKEADEKHAAKTAGAREYLEKLNAVMLQKLSAIGADSVKTPSGTVYRKTRKSATLADAALFRQFIINTEQYDLADWRANAVAIADFITGVGKGSPPPGVNYSTVVDVGVRRA